jgi:hypothetical protein
MSEPLVVVTVGLPEPTAGTDPVTDASRASGQRNGRTTPYPSIEALTRAVRRGRSWRQRLRPRTGHIWTAAVRVHGGADLHLAERDLGAVSDLAAVLGRRSRLMLLLPSPGLLVEAAWRRDVWGGGTTQLAAIVESAAGALGEGFRHLHSATAGVQRRSIATFPAGAELPTAFDEPAWSISARGVEILRRFHTHAVDKKERKLMREFVAETFTAGSEPDPAVTGDDRDRLLLALPDELAELWRQRPSANSSLARSRSSSKSTSMQA